VSTTSRLLIWLLCAVLPLVGIPRAQAGCSGAQSPTPARADCCTSDDCPCGMLVAQGACPCGERTPPPKSTGCPKQHLSTPARHQLLPRGKAVVPPASRPATSMLREATCCPLPDRSRQEVFAVWRC
jgi:hypothetical protein